jgi:hypothetical protein
LLKPFFVARRLPSLAFARTLATPKFFAEQSETSFESLHSEEQKKNSFFFCSSLVFSSLDACRRLLLQEFCQQVGEVTPSRQKKEMDFFCFALDFS